MSEPSFGRRFVDYFAVCGLDVNNDLEAEQNPHAEDGSEINQNQIPPLKRSYKLSVIDRFPVEDVPNCPFDEHGVKMLCMPKGMSFLKNKHPKPKFHSFLLTREDGSKLYGCAMTFYEIIKNTQIKDTMHMLSSMFNTQNKDQEYNEENESNGYDLEASSYDKNKDELFVQKCICILMEQFFVHAAIAWLDHLLSIAFNESDMVLPVESHIYHLLYGVPTPPPGRMLRFSCGGTPITVQMPNINELPLFDFSFKELFKILGSENVVDLFTCMLLEHQILMISKDLNKFMLIAEGMVTLLFPLLWQHVYVPILPKALLHFLDAPVPFIMGLYYETEEERNSFNIPQEGSLCLLDIDNNVIELPEELPLLPGREELITELQSLIGKFSIQSRKGSVFLRQTGQEDTLSPDVDRNQNKGRERARDRRASSVSPNRSSSLSPKSKRNVYADKSRSTSSSLQMDNLLITDKLEENKNITEENISNDTFKEPVVNPRLTAMKAIAEKAGLKTNDRRLLKHSNTLPTISINKEDLFVYGKRAIQVSRKQQHENEFNISVREIFVGRFTQLLVDYESFVILPKQEQQQWILNREQMQNFDKAAFLSDQSTTALPFLTLFVETQGFASLIDMKIMALWEDSSPRLSFFDKRVDKLKVRLGIIRSAEYESCTSIQMSVDAYLNRSNHVDHNAANPTEPKTDLKRALSKKSFPKLQSNLLVPPSDSKLKSSKINWRRGDRKRRNEKPEGQKIKDKLAEKVKQYMQESNVLLSDASVDVTQKAQNAFAERLLRECKLKTTRLVVLKLGQEAVELGHGDQSSHGIEGNTLIASLCDLLERVWCHGVQLRQLEIGNKGSTKSKLVLRMRQSKSALWSHLLAYQKRVKEFLAEEYGLSNLEVPGEDLKRILLDKSRALSCNEFLSEPRRDTRRNSDDGPFESSFVRRASLDVTPDMKSKGRKSVDSIAELEKARKVEMCYSPSFSPRLSRSPMSSPGNATKVDLSRAYELLAKADLLIDLKTIQNMPEIKTDTGSARAWTRLALEKKVLASQLKLLLSDNEILSTRYKDYSFVRSEERMEQFLYHLLSLNAVDFFCYTSGFLKSKTTYRVKIAVGKVFGVSTSANTWMILSGTHMDTGVINMPKNEIEFRFQHTNLGILTALRIGHDNSGLSPSLFIDHVSVLNESTGLLYWFPCGRWLSRNDDDGSSERLLVAEMVKERDENNRLLAKLPPKSKEISPSQNKFNSMSRRISIATRKGPSTSDIQERMADAVNLLVKYFYKEIDNNLTYLLCGESGICRALEMVFQFGLKPKFFGKVFVWDYIERVSQNSLDIIEDLACDAMKESIETFSPLVLQVNNSQSIGKDEKFKILMCLGLRDKLLPEWFELLAFSPVTKQMYDQFSFWLEPSLASFLPDVLQALAGFNITIDPSITRGLQ